MDAFKQGLSERAAQNFVKDKIGKNWEQTLNKASEGILDELKIESLKL